MRAVQTGVENRLQFPLIADNAALGTTLSFLPMFPLRLWKTGGFYPVAAQLDVKTFGG
jgi:hypothetical protein